MPHEQAGEKNAIHYTLHKNTVPIPPIAMMFLKVFSLLSMMISGGSLAHASAEKIHGDAAAGDAASALRDKVLETLLLPALGHAGIIGSRSTNPCGDKPINDDCNAPEEGLALKWLIDNMHDWEQDINMIVSTIIPVH